MCDGFGFGLWTKYNMAALCIHFCFAQTFLELNELNTYILGNKDIYTCMYIRMYVLILKSTNMVTNKFANMHTYIHTSIHFFNEYSCQSIWWYKSPYRQRSLYLHDTQANYADIWKKNELLFVIAIILCSGKIFSTWKLISATVFLTNVAKECVVGMSTFTWYTFHNILCSLSFSATTENDLW